MIDNELFPLWRSPGNERVEAPGLNVDLMHFISNKLGIKIHWVRAPFARCLRLLQHNEVDILNVASYNVEREQFGLYPKKEGTIDISRRFKYDSYAAFVKKDSNITFDGERFEHLDEQPVAVEIGASVIHSLEKMDLKLVKLPEVEHAFNMLFANRVSLVVTNQHNGAKFLDRNVKRLSPNVVDKPYYLMFSRQFYRDNQPLAESVWSASGEMQESYYSSKVAYYYSLQTWPAANP